MQPMGMLRPAYEKLHAAGAPEDVIRAGMTYAGIRALSLMHVDLAVNGLISLSAADFQEFDRFNRVVSGSLSDRVSPQLFDAVGRANGSAGALQWPEVLSWSVSRNAAGIPENSFALSAPGWGSDLLLGQVLLYPVAQGHESTLDGLPEWVQSFALEFRGSMLGSDPEAVMQKLLDRASTGVVRIS